MSWSAIGGTSGGAPAYGNFAGPTSFTFTPVAAAQIGDLVLLSVINETGSGGGIASALSSSNASWSTIGPGFTGTTNAGWTCQIFQGVLTSTSSATVTITWSGTAPSAHVAICGSGFRSTVGSWALDTSGHIDSSGTNTWAALTPAGSGELYFGFAADSTVATAGSTSGFVYEIDTTNQNGTGYALSVSSTMTPVWGDATHEFGVMILVQEGTPVSGGPAPQLPPGLQSPMSLALLMPPPVYQAPQAPPSAGFPTQAAGYETLSLVPPGFQSPMAWQFYQAPPYPAPQAPPSAPPAAQVPGFTGRHPQQPQQGTRRRTWGPVPSGDQVTTPVPRFTGRAARPYQQPRRGVSVSPVPPGTPTNGYPGGTFTGRSSRVFPQPRRGRWWGNVPPGISNIPPLPWTTFTGRHPDLGIKPRRGRTWTPVPPGTPTIGREGGTVTPSRRFPALPRRGRWSGPVPSGAQVTPPPPVVSGRSSRLFQQPRRGRVFQPAPAPVQLPSGREALAWVSRRFPAQWRRSKITVVPQPPVGGAPIIPSTGLGGSVTLSGYGGTVTLPGYGGTVTLPGYGGIVTLPGWGGTITPGGPVVAQQVDIQVPVADDEFINLAITNNGVPVNLTGYGMTVYLKANRYQPNASALATYAIGSGITITNLTGGLATLNIPRAQLPVPAAQWYRCDIIDASSNVYTALYGNVTVQAI